MLIFHKIFLVLESELDFFNIINTIKIQVKIYIHIATVAWVLPIPAEFVIPTILFAIQVKIIYVKNNRRDSGGSATSSVVSAHNHPYNNNNDSHAHSHTHNNINPLGYDVDAIVFEPTPIRSGAR